MGFSSSVSGSHCPRYQTRSSCPLVFYTVVHLELESTIRIESGDRSAVDVWQYSHRGDQRADAEANQAGRYTSA